VKAERKLATTFSESTDLQGLRIPTGARVLDAGCGTGALTREMASRFPDAEIEGCDLSDLRLKQAEKTKGPAPTKVRYFKSALSEIDRPDGYYDLVFAKDVFSLIEDPVRVSRELHRVTKRGGQARIVDFDGMLVNLFPASPELRRMLEDLERRGPADPRTGRKLRELLSQAGFTDVVWEVTAEKFEGNALLEERRLTEQRLALASPLLDRALGSHRRGEAFRRMYLEEMTRPGAVLFYNRFRVHGTK
jgi:SAM-dependent methyltransferase